MAQDGETSPQGKIVNLADRRPKPVTIEDPEPAEIESRWEALRSDDEKQEIAELEAWRAEDGKRRREIGFSAKWKRLCSLVLNRYRNDPNIGDDKEMSFTELRDRIMEPYDSWEKWKGKRRIVRTPLLTRNDLQNWILYDKGIGDEKFVYVDCFIRKIQTTYWYTKVTNSIIWHLEDNHKFYLSELYQNTDNKEIWRISSGFELFENKFFLSQSIDTESIDQSPPFFSRIGLFMKDRYRASFSVIVVRYRSPTQPSLIHPRDADCDIQFGYIIPIGAIDTRQLFAQVILCGDKRVTNLQSYSSSGLVTLDLSRGRIYIAHAPLLEDPHSRLSEINWKDRGKKSWFANIRENGYYDDLTELFCYSSVDSIEEYMRNLNNRYLLW
ncbi:MAG: hypothetical protein WDN24_02225 [Sphingomonas sp.]